MSVIFDVTNPPLSGDVRQSWTLVMNLWQDGTTLHLDGTMTHVLAFGATTTYAGGWTYSDAAGLLLDPASDVGFAEAVADMFNLTVPPGATAAAGGFFGSLISMISNVVQIIINYIINIGIPHTPPTSCLGPRIDSGSCAGNIPCSGDISGLALKIDPLPGVSNGFKKCMKGRMGCGGSNHRRLRISCRNSNDCGACGALVPGADAAGCNVGGTALWYCADPARSECFCSNVIFHEASHSCGALDLRNGANNDSYRIGDWFEAEYQADQGLNGQCNPKP